METARREVERPVSCQEGRVSGAWEVMIRTLACTQSKQVKEDSLYKDLSELSPKEPPSAGSPFLVSSQVSEPHLHLGPGLGLSSLVLRSLERAGGQRL